MNSEPYAPRPAYDSTGEYVFKSVIAYNSRYLVKDNNREYKPRHEWELFYPETLWVEDRWLFVRRVFGDEFIGRIFYRFCDWIWKKNYDMDKRAVEYHRNRCVEKIFRQDKTTYHANYSKPVWAHTWDNRKSGYVTEYTLHRLQERVGLLGPVAGIMGRLMEAELQAYPYETLLKDDMIERSAEEVVGPLCGNDFKDKMDLPDTEKENPYEDYSSYDEYGECGYDPHDYGDDKDPEHRYHERMIPRHRIPDPRPGIYTDRRERDRHMDDRSPLRRHRASGSGRR